MKWEEKKKTIAQESYKMFVIYLKLIAFEYALIVKESLWIFLKRRKQKLQCNGLMSKHSNSFLIVFIVCHQFFFFCKTNFDVFTIFSKLLDLKKYVLLIEIYIPMERSNLSLTKYSIIWWKRRRKKQFFKWLQGHVSPNFLLFWVALVYGKIM